MPPEGKIRDIVRCLIFRDENPPPLERHLTPPLETQLDRNEARLSPWTFSMAVRFSVSKVVISWAMMSASAR